MCGNGGQGALGFGNYTDKLTLTLHSGTNWKNLKYGWGARHSLATKTDGTLWATGQGSTGKLGDGTTTTRNTWVQIGAGTDWDFVRAAALFSVGLKNDGTIWGMGANYTGALATGSQDFSDHTTPQQIGTDTDWTDVFPGSDFALALKS
jgi:alpha-tubulin suppressor-like RCC1 family protein